MPPQQTPLGPINGNTNNKAKLSKFKRGRIIGIHDGGKTKAHISRYYHHPYLIVTEMISNNPLHNNSKSLPQTGTPKCYIDAEERLVLRHVRNFPKDTYAQVITICVVTFKKGTVKKILKEHGIKN